MSGQVLPDRGPNRRPPEMPTQKAHLERLVAHYGSSTGVAPGRVRRWLSVMVLLGAHYIPFVFLYGMRMFAVMAALVVGGDDDCHLLVK